MFVTSLSKSIILSSPEHSAVASTKFVYAGAGGPTATLHVSVSVLPNLSVAVISKVLSPISSHE